MRSWQSPAVPALPPEPGVVTAYDSARQAVVDVGPAVGTARMYVCGITPYDSTHMGHANTNVTFDLLNRAWRDAGLQVRYVQNVTDVDDPLLERAAQTGVDWTELAERETERFRADMAALNVLAPDEFVAATETIDLVTAHLQRLQQHDAVYQLGVGEPDFYYHCAADPKFGSVAHLSEADALAVFAERGGDPDRTGKKDQFDCLVWLHQRVGEPGWASPLGIGRPGWHIECTAIALEHLGANFDVQGGGSDLVFPHHEMSASQARTATGQEFARAFVHAGMVGLDGEKMSKSKGNLVLVSQLLERGVDPMAIRLALLANHYRSDWSWTDDLLEAARQRLQLWRSAACQDATLNADRTLAEVRAALRNDLDAPRALAAIDAWAGASVDAGASGKSRGYPDSDDTDGAGLVHDLVAALLGVTL